MSRITFDKPLYSIHKFDKSYQVEVCLKKPLWSKASEHDIPRRILVLCAQLDILCKRELYQGNEPLKQSSASDAFLVRAPEIRQRIVDLFSKMPQSVQNLSQWLYERRIGHLYGRAVVYLDNPHHFVIYDQTSAMESYFKQMSQLNQIHSLCTQLNCDVTNLSSHKYVAHQLALLHQSIKAVCKTNASTHSRLDSIRDEIAAHFQSLKDSITVSEDETPYLPDQYKQWLLDVTSELSTIATSFSAPVNHILKEPTKIISEIT